MSNKKLAIRGVLWTGVTHVVSIAATFFVTPILLRTLGAEQYGIWSIVMALTGYYGLVNMGIGKANTKYISQFDALGDRDTVCKIVSTALAILASMAVVILAVSGIVAWLFPCVFDVGEYPIHLARLIVLLTGLKVAVELVGQVFVAGIVARKRFDLSNALSSGQLLLVAILTIIVVKLGGGLVGMAAVFLCVNILARLIGWFLAIWVVGLPRPSRRGVDIPTGAMLFRFGSLSMVMQVVRRTSLVGGSLILGLFAGPAAVGFYSVAESLTRKSLNLGKTINRVVMPFASQLQAEEDQAGLRRLLLLPTRLLLVLAFLIAMVLLLFGKSFLTLWISPDVAANVYPIVCILSMCLLVKLPANGIESTLVGMGRMTFLSRLAIAEGLTMVVAGVVLTPVLGGLGMAFAVLISQITFSGAILPVYACGRVEYSKVRFALSTAGPALLSVLPALVIAILFDRFMPVDRLYLVLAQMAVVTVVTVIVAFFVCLDPPMRSALLQVALARRFCKSRLLSARTADTH